MEAIMSVKAILDRKGFDVVTIEPGATLGQAVRLLAERKIGAVVVTGIGRSVSGILSERDVVRAIGERGADILAEPVASLMTRKVVTCGVHDTVADLMEKMTDGKFRHVPVVDKGKLVAIVSIGDVVKHRIEEAERESRALRDYILTA
jgi:CBS domain-containing protein